MILAAGLTPAWQQILQFDSFQVGEVNRAEKVTWCASGKVLNVGIALSQMGGPSKTVALIGGQSGEAICGEFRDESRAARWVTTDAATRVCTTILDRQCDETTELVENSSLASVAELEDYLAAYSEEAANAELVVLSGSLPQGTPSSYYRDMLAQTSGCAILDVRGPELLEAMQHEPFLVKPNREELARTLGKNIDDDRSLVAAMRALNDRGAEWVVITQGSDDVWATSQNNVFRLSPPEATVVNPIGCGDCMAAGIAWGVSEGREPVDAIRIGMAAAADNVGELLPARLDRQRVLDVADSIDVVSVA